MCVLFVIHSIHDTLPARHDPVPDDICLGLAKNFVSFDVRTFGGRGGWALFPAVTQRCCYVSRSAIQCIRMFVFDMYHTTITNNTHTCRHYHIPSCQLCPAQRPQKYTSDTTHSHTREFWVVVAGRVGHAWTWDHMSSPHTHCTEILKQNAARDCSGEWRARWRRFLRVLCGSA